MALHNEIGVLGEEIATKWLIDHGYAIVVSNYRRRAGEIDIVARETAGKIHFVEVKSVSYETREDLEYSVSHETWRPEDMVHLQKQQRLLRVIQLWLQENPTVDSFQIDVITVKMVPREKYALVHCIENIVFEQE